MNIPFEERNRSSPVIKAIGLVEASIGASVGFCHLPGIPKTLEVHVQSGLCNGVNLSRSSSGVDHLPRVR